MANATATKPKTEIQSSVGQNGRNRIPDIITVFELLKVVPINRGGLGNPNLDVYKLGSAIKRRDLIRDFQMHHFGVSNGRIDPGGMTHSQLVKEVTGSRPAGQSFMSPVNFKAMVTKVRDTIVQIANAEANRSDRPQPVAKNAPAGTRDKKQAARLKEYFKVYDMPPSDQSEYTKGRPTDTGYCGIFATWVVNQALRKCGFVGNMQFQNGGKIFYHLGPNHSFRRNFFKDGNTKGADLIPMRKVTYSKGDICLVKEVPEEVWPTHHFIVAEYPTPGSPFKTVEGNYAEAGRYHAVTNKNQRAMLNYGYLSVMQPESM